MLGLLTAALSLKQPQLSRRSALCGGAAALLPSLLPTRAHAAAAQVAAHPPLECSLQLTAHGERPAAEEGERAVPLVASILLRVRLPVEYPKTPPVLAIEDVMVTTQEPLGRDKMLTTVARLNEDALVAAMLERAAATLPEPCIYEVATYLTESALEAVGHSWV